MKSYQTDYHVHPNYSADASPVKIKEYCFRALELGLKEICFTSHLELNPASKNKTVILNGERVSVLDPTWLDSYFKELDQARAEFKSTELKIKAGIEVGYCPEEEEIIAKILDNYPFDFVLGAIHSLNQISISSMLESPHYFQNKNLLTVQQDYFSRLSELVDSKLFDCIAHIDIYCRYGLRYHGPDILTLHRGVIEPIFAKMARQGMGLEINTSSRRRGLKEFHPSLEILTLAAQSGLEIFTVGSDAHSLDELGSDIEEALELLKKLNLSNHVYNRRRPQACSDF
ncbi:MAG: histidinol-phosphatase [Desulfitobacteriia bacterium]